MRKGLSFIEAGRLGGIKSIESNTRLKKERVEEYEKNPKVCKHCLGKIPYEKRSNDGFCSRHCSVSFNNLNKIRNGNIPNNCLNCNKKLNRFNKKYCNITCQNENEWNIRKEKIEKEGEEKSSVCAKKYILEKRGHICEICKITEWMNQKTPLVLDHINGYSEDNKLSNLRLICPNCDAQTSTYKGKNKGNGRAWRMKRFYEGKSY